MIDFSFHITIYSIFLLHRVVGKKIRSNMPGERDVEHLNFTYKFIEITDFGQDNRDSCMIRKCIFVITFTTNDDIVSIFSSSVPL